MPTGGVDGGEGCAQPEAAVGAERRGTGGLGACSDGQIGSEEPGFGDVVGGGGIGIHGRHRWVNRAPLSAGPGYFLCLGLVAQNPVAG